MQNKEYKMIPEGAVLDFYRQIPTYIDRKPFYMGIIGIKTESLIWEGREFFVKMIDNHLSSSKQDIRNLLNSVLNNIIFLYFEVYNNG